MSQEHFLVKSGVRRGGKGFSSTLWLVYLKHFQTSSLWFFWTFCPNLKALTLLDIFPNLKALILLNILLNLLMLLALHRWGIEKGVGIESLTIVWHKVINHKHMYLPLLLRTQQVTGYGYKVSTQTNLVTNWKPGLPRYWYQHRQTSWQTENPDSQDIGKKTNKILAECRGPQPPQKKRGGDNTAS